MASRCSILQRMHRTACLVLIFIYPAAGKSFLKHASIFFTQRCNSLDHFINSFIVSVLYLHS